MSIQLREYPHSMVNVIGKSRILYQMEGVAKRWVMWEEKAMGVELDTVVSPQ